MKTKWISVKDRLPKNLQSILVYHEKGIVYSGGFYEGPDKFSLNAFNGAPTINIDEFTHWQPLPPAPSSDKH